MFVEEVRKAAQDFPDVAVDDVIVDTFAMRLVRDPQTFDVVVTTNMFGDILSDEAAGLVGGLGMAPGLCLGGGQIAMAQATHGSAPDIAGKGIANPYAMIESSRMLLEWLGRSRGIDAAVAAADDIKRALDHALSRGRNTDWRHPRHHGNARHGPTRSSSISHPEEKPMRKPVIGLTLGDPTGIGAEIVARVLQEKLLPAEADILLIGDRRQLAQGESDIGGRLDVRIVGDAAAVDFTAPGIPMLDLANMDPAAITRGKVSSEAGRLTGETLHHAIKLGQAGHLDAITFAPLNKQALHSGGWRYLDEHKMFADLLGHKSYFSEMNVVEGQWMSRVTSHVSLRKAPRSDQSAIHHRRDRARQPDDEAGRHRATPDRGLRAQSAWRRGRPLRYGGDRFHPPDGREGGWRPASTARAPIPPTRST